MTRLIKKRNKNRKHYCVVFSLLLQFSENLFTVVFYAVVFVWTGFVDKLPAVWRWQLSTSIGRLFFVLLLWIVLEVGGWVPATLVAVAICMTWAVRPLFAPQGRSLCLRRLRRSLCLRRRSQENSRLRSSLVCREGTQGESQGDRGRPGHYRCHNRRVG